MAMNKELWKVLEKEAKKQNHGVVRRLYSSDISIYISLGIHTDSMRHFIAFEIKEDFMMTYKSLPNIKGLVIDKVKYGDEKADTVSLALSAASAVYNPSFDILCDDLIEHVKANPEQGLVSSLSDRLSLWKKFFSEVPCEILSEEKQTGLAGELNFILKLLSLKVNKSVLIRSWKGYDHSSKDFIFPRLIAVEVKASKSGKSINVSSEDQLDESEYEKCMLYFCNILSSNDSGISLNQLIDQIRENLSDSTELIRKFNEDLSKYGYYDIHREYYHRYFHLKNEQIFSVEGDFPRIRKAELRKGVTSTKYAIDLTLADSHQNSFSEIIDLFDRGAE